MADGKTGNLTFLLCYFFSIYFGGQRKFAGLQPSKSRMRQKSDPPLQLFTPPRSSRFCKISREPNLRHLKRVGTGTSVFLERPPRAPRFNVGLEMAEKEKTFRGPPSNIEQGGAGGRQENTDRAGKAALFKCPRLRRPDLPPPHATGAGLSHSTWRRLCKMGQQFFPPPRATRLPPYSGFLRLRWAVPTAEGRVHAATVQPGARRSELSMPAARTKTT